MLGGDSYLCHYGGYGCDCSVNKKVLFPCVRQSGNGTFFIEILKGK